MLPDFLHSVATDDPQAAHVARQIEKFRKQLLDRPSKIAIHKDLDPKNWPAGRGLTQHTNIRTLLAQSDISDMPYAEDRGIDEDKEIPAAPFLICDADASQRSAIVDVLAGKNLTICGSPETGKSQTIANLISAAIMANKKVLFVAEKLTALDVVYDCLDKAGLGPFCLNLHTQRVSSAAVQDQIDRRVNIPETGFNRSQYNRQKDDWEKQRQGLKIYTRIADAKIDHLDETVHDILWRKINIWDLENRSTDGKIQLSDVDTQITRDARRLLDHTRDKIENLRRLRDNLSSRFYLGDLPSPSELRRHAGALCALRGPWLLSRSARDAVRRYRRLVSKVSKKPDKTSAAEKAADFCKLAEYLETLSQLKDDSGISECLRRFWHGKADRLNRMAECIEALGLSEAYPISQTGDLIESLEDIQPLCDAMSNLKLDDEVWRKIANFCAQTLNIGNMCSELQNVIEREREVWSELAEVLLLIEIEHLDGKFHDAERDPDLRKRAEECRAARAALLSSSSFQRAGENGQRSHAARMFAAVEEYDAPLARLDDAYESALCWSLFTVIYCRHPELGALSGRQLRNHHNAVEDIESRHQELERVRVAHELYSRPVEAEQRLGEPRAYGGMALIQDYLSLQHGKLTPREPVRRANVALRQLKPCFMMSPTTVAEILPRDDALFDIVVVDEAAQMLPSDALGAIARGRQTVIVGDPEQLPPSTYFQGRAALAQSILDLSLSAWRPLRSLDHDVIEVEDTVFYRHAEGGTNVRRVTIVRGVDDVTNGIISDYKPLATALLGAAVGETVTVRQPTHEVDMVVVRIETKQVRERLEKAAGLKA